MLKHERCTWTTQEIPCAFEQIQMLKVMLIKIHFQRYINKPWNWQGLCNYYPIMYPRHLNTWWVGVWTPKHLLRMFLGVPNTSLPGIWGFWMSRGKWLDRIVICGGSNRCSSSPWKLGQIPNQIWKKKQFFSFMGWSSHHQQETIHKDPFYPSNQPVKNQHDCQCQPSVQH